MTIETKNDNIFKICSKQDEIKKRKKTENYFCLYSFSLTFVAPVLLDAFALHLRTSNMIMVAVKWKEKEINWTTETRKKNEEVEYHR